MSYAGRGELIWLAGSPIQFAAVIGSGFIKMTRTTPQGNEVAVELLGPGQCLGLMVLLEGRTYPLNAVAVTDCWYLKVPSRAFLDLYDANPGLRDTMFRSLAPRLRRAHEMMARMTSDKVEQRVAAILLILLDSYGRESDRGVTLTVPLTRQDLSEMAGTTVESTIRVMSRWQKEGAVTTDKQWITVLDLASLESLLAD
ncbi:MAG: Crp/Fnr family transcriptional regulator [Armatimonadetes bacterium]|nr:Crp/Fnr family transcriptional regulator [Armatimonadota bacterium]